MEKVLYEHKGERINWATTVENETEPVVTDDNGNVFEEEYEPGDGMRYLQQLQLDTTLVLLPDRYAKREAYIEAAIEVAELYDFDTKIVEHDSHISVDYSFDCGGNAVFLINIIEMSDSICFFTKIFDREITLSLDYYTHAVFLKDRLVAPINRKD